MHSPDWTGFEAHMDFSNVDWTKVIGVVVTIASALSNVIPPYTIVGKILHLFALNFRSGNLTDPKAEQTSGGGA